MIIILFSIPIRFLLKYHNFKRINEGFCKIIVLIISNLLYPLKNI